MPRCGCASGTCSCRVVQGAGVTVTGIGSQDQPYIVSVNSVAVPPLMPNGPAGTTVCGLPGCSLLPSLGTLAPALGLTTYWPIEVTDAITVTSILAEVTTAVANSSTRVALYAADPTWQPTALVADFGALATATVGVKTWAGSAVLPRGRYLIAARVSTAASTFRAFPYALPNAGGMVATLGTTPYMSRFTVTEAYAAFQAVAIPWTTIAVAATPGFLSPFALKWTSP